MTIATYAQLKTAIADFLNRDDLTAVIPTFITLAEASFNRKLRDWRMVKRSTTAFDEPFELLPDGWLETIRLGMPGQGPLKLVSSQDMMLLKADHSPPGIPKYFAHTAGQLEFWPEPSADAGTGQMVYYAQIEPLGELIDRNWLLSAAPDLYLYGSLLHSAPYLKDDPRIVVWGGLYRDILNSMMEESKAAQHSGPISMRLRNG